MRSNPLSRTSLVVSLVLFLSAPVVEAHGRGGFRCPPQRHQRTPQQVLADHEAAIASGNLDLVMCDYDDDAQVLMPGTVLSGEDEIRAALSGFMAAFGGVAPNILTRTFGERGVVLVTWNAFLPQFSVPDGADTFIIKHGLIRAQTVHATFAPPVTP